MTTVVNVSACCAADEEVRVTESQGRHPDGRQRATKETFIQNGESCEFTVVELSMFKVEEVRKRAQAVPAKESDKAG